MAKELPYYKFEPSEWLEGEIQICSDAAIVCFTNLCSGYWLKLGSMSYAFALHKYMRKDANLMQELINSNVIAVQEDEISINFLDKQLKEFKVVSDKRSFAAKKRWSKNTVNQDVNANALQVYSKSNAIREEKIREDKIITKKVKTFSDDILKCFNNCLKYFPEHLHPKNNNSWLDTIDKLNRIDKIPFSVIEEVVRKIRMDSFWGKNFLSINKLRNKNKEGVYYISVFAEHIKSNNLNAPASQNEQYQNYIEEIRRNNPNL